jgi:hypothetical protein
MKGNGVPRTEGSVQREVGGPGVRRPADSVDRRVRRHL